ncbi:MAG: PTS sugar transporter subunit IIA [Pirellulales bacterium]|nr:PTS sugar transporter subunit IIA [Pirellulales bacterium]
MKLLRKALLDGCFLLDLDERDLPSLFRQVVNYLVVRGSVVGMQQEEVEAALLAREEDVSTAIGNAVAIPHAYLDAVREPTIVFVRLAHPLNLGAPDGVPTRFVFVLLGSAGAAAQHLDVLADIARLAADDEFRYEAGMAHTQLDLLAALDRFGARNAPKALHDEKRSECLDYTGRLFGGVAADLRRRLPHYVSDFRDGLHTKSLASTLFLFFACLAPAVTFGGIMAELTGHHIGAVEMIVGSALCGVVYALLAGQPLIILGGTGPLLVYTWLLYVLCSQIGLDGCFLEARAWVGLWTGLLLIILAATDASCLVKYFTRFTDEIFSALISLIFIYAAVEALAQIVSNVYQDDRISHDRALVPLILAMGTFFIAYGLYRFRRSRYLLPHLREFFADFGPTIALAAMTVVAVTWFHDVERTSLPAPDAIQPTIDRSWLIPLFDAPRWVWFAAAGPAVLAAVLVYLDQNITARLINSRDHRLQKGEAYHYDLAVMGVLIAVCSLFGLPWLVAATVRSLNHIRSLATVESVVTRGGDSRDSVLHVRETRVTGLAIHLLIGLSLFALPLLKQIPMAVLYGLFLFMGIVSMAGNQFFERLRLWLMDSSLYPTTHYIRRVPIWTIHRFTLLQLICLIVLALVEVTPLGILFPLFLVLLVPIRFYAGRFFTAEELAALDSEEEPEEEA